MAPTNFINLKIVNRIQNRWKQIPEGIRTMLVFGSVLLLIWKSIYTFWLEPERILDKPLTRTVTSHSIGLLQIMGPGSHYSIGQLETRHKGDRAETIEHLFIIKDGAKTISVADNCNGLELMVLYAAFIVVMPGSWKRKILFILFGIPLLHLANLVRVMGLVGLHVKYPGMFDFAHHYLFKIVIYGLTFLLWVWYLNKKKQPKSAA